MGGRPLIALSACIKAVGSEPGMLFHATPHPYVAAVATVAGGLPLLMPALGEALDRTCLLDRVDGLLLTGSLSNVHPSRYGHEDDGLCPPHDEGRDATTLPLIREALDRGLPLLAICRGIQELNVALGGSLYPQLTRVAGRSDHRSAASAGLEEQFAPVHRVTLTPGGLLAGLAGESAPMVNSLHGQGIDRLAPGLMVEAIAPDGQIEAVRVENRPFALGVQWHPEWAATTDPFSRAIFEAFGAAARAHMRCTHGSYAIL